MPKKPIDYKKAVIYSIVSKTDESLLYVGSTTDFRRRKASHKHNCNTDKSTPVYVTIRANGGWDAFVMKPVKEYPCENKTQLVIEEERIRKEMNANLNANKANETIEERKEYRKEYDKEHYQQNRDKYSEYKKEYNKQNKTQIAEQKRQYYLLNRDKILQQQKESRLS
jgi:hypothetical protein